MGPTRVLVQPRTKLVPPRTNHGVNTALYLWATFPVLTMGENPIGVRLNPNSDCTLQGCWKQKISGAALSGQYNYCRTTATQPISCHFPYETWGVVIFTHLDARVSEPQCPRPAMAAPLFYTQPGPYIIIYVTNCYKTGV